MESLDCVRCTARVYGRETEQRAALNDNELYFSISVKSVGYTVLISLIKTIRSYEYVHGNPLEMYTTKILKITD